MRRIQHLRSALAAATVLLLALGTVLTTTVPAVAADPAALEVDKLVDGQKSATLGPGDEFSFSIRLGCDDSDCVDAHIEDPLPPELDGFEIVNLSVSPPNPAPPAAPDWVASYTGCSGTPPTEVTSDPPCIGVVDFVQPLADGSTGMTAGQAYTLTMTLRVPVNLPPTWAYNGQPITNTGTGTAANAPTTSSSATITVDVPTTVDTDVTKSWSPASERYSPGSSSVIDVTASNASNTPASSIVVQDPADAPEGAASLAPTNPFRYVDATGVGDVTFPAGATAVQVDAYVLDPDTGEYHWITGTPAATAALPAGVDPGDVGGLRYTFTAADGAVLAPGTPAAGVEIEVAQRATDRNGGTALDGGWSDTNTASGTVTVPGEDPLTDGASADHTVVPTTLAVSTTKTIDPSRIPAGGTADGVVTATNDSDGPVAELTVSDLDYFTDTVGFDGFTAPLSYPDAATGARITWYFSDGSTTTDAVADGSTPSVTPTDDSWVTGFEIVYDGPIEPGAAVTVPFGIATTPDAADDGALDTTNTATAVVTNGDASADDDATATLDVLAPDIDIALDKTLSPAEPVAPGGTVVAELPATTSTDTAFVTPTTIVVDDVAPTPHESDSFWNAFDPTAIAPTEVPPGVTLTIRYTTDDGVTWQDLPMDGLPATGPTSFSGPIPADLQGEITGLRFVFTDPSGFPQGTTVQPNVVAQARAEQRWGGDPTSTPDAGPTTYSNHATAQGEGAIAGGGTIDSDVVDADATASIETNTGEGSVIAGKRWTDATFAEDRASVDSQSGEQVGTVLEWGTRTTGTDSITVSDPRSGAATPEETTFQAFDLDEIAAVPLTADDRWRWDTVTSIELFSGGTWSTVPEPTTGWVDATGFVGYTLSDAERASTTGVRLTVAPDDDARAASTDPTRPVPGSGITPSTVPRQFDLVWQLRNTLRVPSDDGDRWVNGTTVYNLSGAGSIRNEIDVSGVTADGTVDAAAHDDVVVIDRPPLVAVTKSSEHDTLSIPTRSDVDPQDYPTNDWTVTARNGASARASYIRVTDPMRCTPTTLGDCTSDPDAWGSDPFEDAPYGQTNPFERFTLTGLDFDFDQTEVDPDASVVTLQNRADDGTLSTSTTTISGARAATAADLADVVGVSVVYQGTDPATTGGTITTADALVMTMHTQLRKTLRSFPAVPVTVTSVTNRSFAQSYDPVLAPSGQTSTPSDSSSAGIDLVRGVLAVDATKTFAPDTLLEADRSDPVDVTLAASQGDTATASPNSVTIEDSDDDFWNTVRLSDFSATDVTFPAGADQVRVDVRLDGSASWQEGTPSATAALPTTDLAAVSGIRFVFDRADGDVLSHTAPPPEWTASAVLHVTVLDTARDGTTIAFPSTVDDTVTTMSHRDDDALYPDATATADDVLDLDPGTRALDIVKAPANDQHTVAVGSAVPWTITMRNTGTGLITLTSLRDELPAELTWDGNPTTATTSDGGTLSTDITTTADDAGRVLTVTWPDDADRMAPGEVFTITVPLTLEAGLQEGEHATNTAVAVTDSALDACTNSSGNGQGTVAGLPATECGTTNFVQPTPGPALATDKAVRGDVVDPLVTGAAVPGSPDTVCAPDDDGFFLPPCVADTRVGGTDEWRLHALNTGTVNQDTVTFVDPLPRPGDVLLATGSARGSSYRPVFDGAFGVVVDAPDGASTTWQVTTDEHVCGTADVVTTWSTDPTCTGNTWTDGGAFTGDWAAVTGLRVIADLTASGGLAPGGDVSAAYRTTNTPRGADTPDGVVAAVPLGDQVAYDQVGTTVTLANGGLPISQAPVKVGVAPTSGSLQVRKVVAGGGASAAPDRFVADVDCSVAGALVDMGDSASVVIDRAGDLTARVDRIPVGATCAVSERGDVGLFGETSRTVTPGDVVVLEPTTADDPVPDTQLVTITNTYMVGPSPAPPSPVPSAPTDGGTASGGIPSDPGALAFTGTNGPAALVLLVLAGTALATGLVLRRRMRHR